HRVEQRTAHALDVLRVDRTEQAAEELVVCGGDLHVAPGPEEPGQGPAGFVRGQEPLPGRGVEPGADRAMERVARPADVEDHESTSRRDHVLMISYGRRPRKGRARVNRAAAQPTRGKATHPRPARPLAEAPRRGRGWPGAGAGAEGARLGRAGSVPRRRHPPD